jgi:hypothetical protein
MRKTILEKYGRLVSNAQLDGREIYHLGDSFYAVDGDRYIEVSAKCDGQTIGSWEDFEEYEPASSLDELFEQMKNDDPDLPPWDDLPTFGGPDIQDTEFVWSWDEERKIVGTCSKDIRIVERDDI